MRHLSPHVGVELEKKNGVKSILGIFKVLGY